MGQILNIWIRKRTARVCFPVGCKVQVKMPEAWLDGKVGAVVGHDMFGPDIDLELHIMPEDVMTTAPMKNCQRL